LGFASSGRGPAALMFQDDASSSWRKRKKHFFILSNSGKPIYSRYRGSGIPSQGRCMYYETMTPLPPLQLSGMGMSTS
jgi:hypothetical protein